MRGLTIRLSEIKVILKLSICQDAALPLVVTQLAEKATVFITEFPKNETL